METACIQERLRRVRCFLLDMDGTFYLGNKLLEGSLDFLAALEAKGKEAIFLTNNSSQSGQHYVSKLRRMGVEEPFLRVLTSGQAACRWAMRNRPGQKAFLLGNRFLKEECRAAGLPLTEEKPDYVLVAYDTELDYQKLTMVCDFVRDGLPYIATHPDLNCPTEHGYAPDIGAITAFIHASTQRWPDVIIGKPHQGIIQEALTMAGQPSHALAMVGDRLYTDIQTALNSGMTGILVLTGETTRQMLASSATKPHLVFDRLSAMIPYL